MGTYGCCIFRNSVRHKKGKSMSDMPNKDDAGGVSFDSKIAGHLMNLAHNWSNRKDGEDTDYIQYCHDKISDLYQAREDALSAEIAELKEDIQLLEGLCNRKDELIAKQQHSLNKAWGYENESR